MYSRVPVFVAFLAGCGGAPELTLCGAASTSSALEEAAQAWRMLSSEPLQTCAGATSVLVRGAQRGQPMDVLLGAHREWMSRLSAVDQVDLLANEVVVVSREGQPGLEELMGARCVAVGDPGHVPAGLYAQAALEALDRWEALEGRIVPTVDAPAAVAAVRSGVCPVALAYRTDAVGLGIGAVLEVDPPVRYPLVLLSERGRPLFDWLQTEAGRAPFEARGFGRP